MPLIEYTEPRIHIVRGSKGVEFEFRPGAENEVPEDVWEDLKEHSQGTKTLLARSLLRVVTISTVKSAAKGRINEDHVSDDVPISDKFPKRRAGKPKPVKDEPTEAPKQIETIADINIAAMTAFDAVDFIGKIFSEKTLERFRSEEEKHRRGPRRQVMAALDAQLAVMRTDITKGSGQSKEN